jgi:HSP20 family protein
MLPRIFNAQFSPLTAELEGLFRTFAQEQENAPAPKNGTPQVATYSAPVDIYEYEDRFELVLDAPGVRREDVKISLENDTLTIAGERAAPTATEETRKNLRGAERWAGKFSRTITLPNTVDGTRVEAKLADGVLRLSLPKSERAKPRTIQVN